MGSFNALLLAVAVGSLDVFVLAALQALPHDPAATSQVPQPPPPPTSSSNATFTGSMTVWVPHPEVSGQTLDSPGWDTTSSSTVLIVAPSAHTEITAGEFDTPSSTTSQSSSKIPPTLFTPHEKSSRNALYTPTRAPKARVESTASSFDVPLQITRLPDPEGTTVLGPVTETARVEVSAGTLDDAGPQSFVTATGGGSSVPVASVVGNHPVGDQPNAPAVTSAPGPHEQPIYVGSVPILPGSPTLVLSGTTYSLASSGSSLYANGVLTPVIAVPAAYEPAVYVSNTPVLPGSSAQVIGGTTYSLANTGSTLFVDGSPTPVSALPQQQASPTAVSVEDHTVSPGSSAQVIASKTYSLAADWGVLYVNGVASTLSATPSASAGAVSSGEDDVAETTSRASDTGVGSGSSTGKGTPTQTSSPQVQTEEGNAGMLAPGFAGLGIGLLAVILL